MGVLNAVTAREYARVAAPDASQFDTEVEPLSNYFAGRVAKDFLEGNLQVRAMATSVVRDLRDPALAGRLTRHAEAGGLDAQWWLAGRAYRWTLSAAVTQVAGDSTAMLGVQRSSARYFQRPDREHGANGLFTDAYDPGLGAMRGWGVESRLSREAGNWLWEVNAGARSPGFETNDLAFLQRTDYVWMNANLVRRRTTPQWLFRNYWLLLGGQQQYNFDGDLVSRQARALANVTFRNYWTLSTFAIHRLSTLCDQITRGGPIKSLGEARWCAYPRTLAGTPGYGRIDGSRCRPASNCNSARAAKVPAITVSALGSPSAQLRRRRPSTAHATSSAT